MSDDVQFQVECLTTDLTVMLMEEYGWDMRHALDELYTSETFRRLNDESTGLYYESPVYVFSYLKSEIEEGSIK